MNQYGFGGFCFSSLVWLFVGDPNVPAQPCVLIVCNLNDMLTEGAALIRAHVKVWH